VGDLSTQFVPHVLSHLLCDSDELVKGEIVNWKSFPQKTANAHTPHPRYFMMMATQADCEDELESFLYHQQQRHEEQQGADYLVHGNETQFNDVYHESLWFVPIGTVS
jgi:hypothetical protein